MEYEILQAKAIDVSTLKVNGYFIHSRYNPLKEAETFAKKSYKAACTHVLVGNGLGYYVKALLNEFKHQEKLVVIEPFFKIVDREIADNIIYIEEKNVELLKVLIGAYLDDEYEVNYLETPNYSQIDSDVINIIREAVKNQVTSNLLSFNTVNRFSNRWFNNLIENLYYATSDESLSALLGKFDKPIVIASGGPSLTKQLPLLKKIRKEITLLSAGSTISSLIKEDIIPDYVVNVDGGEANIEHYSDIKDSKINYIYSLFCAPEIRGNFTGKAYYFNQTGFRIHTDLNKIFDELVLINAGISVATFSLAIAIEMTSAPIAIIGQDLAFTNLKTHADNNKNMKNITDLSNYKLVEGYYGDEVYTDFSLMSMKYNFELLMLDYADNYQIFNCTEGGAKIKGMDQLPFEEFCNRYIQSVEHSVVNISDEPLKNDNNKKNLYKNYLKKQLSTIEKLLLITKDSLKLLEKDADAECFNEKNSKKMSKNNKKMMELLDAINAPLIFDKVAMNTEVFFKPQENESKYEEFLRTYRQQYYLYTGVIENASSIKDVIEKFIEEKEWV